MKTALYTNIIFASLMLACGGPDTTGITGSSTNTICEPGKQETCPCPGGTDGAQACNDDGTGFETCQCGTSNSSTSSGNVSSSSSTGGGGASSSSMSSSVSSGSTGGASSSSSSSGTGGCMPSTQAEACMGLDCGMVDAGCGFMVSCGADPLNPDACDADHDGQFQSCGLGDVALDANGKANGQVKPGVPNVCGGNCARMEAVKDAMFCGGTNPDGAAWFCSKPKMCPGGSQCPPESVGGGATMCSSTCDEPVYCLTN